MKATYHSVVHKFSLFVVAWAALLLCAGALVTSNDAALAVSDWPTSFGSFFPPLRFLTGGALIEHTHRVLAAILGIWIITLAILLWRNDERAWVKKVGYAAVGGVIVQGILGGLTVLQLLHYWLPVMHACTAELVFALLVSISVFTSRWYSQDLPQYADAAAPSVHSIAIANAIFVFVQVLLGAGYRHHYISYVPHVLNSVLVMTSVSVTAGMLRRRFPKIPEFVRMRKLLNSIVGLQFLLGIGALWSRIQTADAPQPMPVMIAFTVVHTVVGAILFATSIATVLVCYRLVPRGREVLLATSKGEVPAV
jgi:cytochrome c oxidase assembly protein subunit 15